MTAAPTIGSDRTFASSTRVALCIGLGVALLGAACSDSGSEDEGSTAEPASAATMQSPMSNAPTASSPEAGEDGGTDEAGSGGAEASGADAGDADAVVENGDAVMPPIDGAAASARYRVVLDVSWSPETHPEGFPGNPHFSGLVGAVHNEQVRFWEPGQIATDGIRNVAETGGKNPLRGELQAAIDDGRALTLVDGPGVPASPGLAEVDIEVTRDYPELTLVTMLAPSPDWFVGVHGLSLLVDGAFVDERTIDLILYDAGTDSGLGYESSNAPTAPRSPIERVSSEAGDSPFVDGGPSVGTLRIERIAAP